MRLLKKSPCRLRRAFSLLEVAVTLTIVTVSLAMFAQTMAASRSLDPVASETAVAASAARTMLEEMKNRNFDELFALYNADASDDPDGSGTGPGPNFEVPDLTPLVPGGLAGRIVFPVDRGRLAEDVVDAALSMPRDLNSDDTVDALDHSTDYNLLPIRIRIDWIAKGTKNRQRKFEMFTMYTSFRP